MILIAKRIMFIVVFAGKAITDDLYVHKDSLEISRYAVSQEELDQAKTEYTSAVSNYNSIVSEYNASAAVVRYLGKS